MGENFQTLGLYDYGKCVESPDPLLKLFISQCNFFHKGGSDVHIDINVSQSSGSRLLICVMHGSGKYPCSLHRCGLEIWVGYGLESLNILYGGVGRVWIFFGKIQWEIFIRVNDVVSDVIFLENLTYCVETVPFCICIK